MKVRDLLKIVTLSYGITLFIPMIRAEFHSVSELQWEAFAKAGGEGMD